MSTMPTFIPANGPTAPAPPIVSDDWYPPLSLADCRGRTGLGTVFADDRVTAEIRASALDVMTVLSDWRGRQTAASLAEVPGPSIDGQPGPVVWFETAVYTRVRAKFCDVTRDYDSTKSGHARADALEQTADAWERQSNEALSRLMGRGRTVVELI